MKIAITSMGKDINSLASERFGRAPYFIIFDTEKEEIISIENTAVSVGGGAGPEAVRQISSNGAKVILTGNLGGNAETSLKSAGIKAITGISGQKTVKQIIEEYKASNK